MLTKNLRSSQCNAYKTHAQAQLFQTLRTIATLVKTTRSFLHSLTNDAPKKKKGDQDPRPRKE